VEGWFESGALDPCGEPERVSRREGDNTDVYRALLSMVGDAVNPISAVQSCFEMLKESRVELSLIYLAPWLTLHHQTISPLALALYPTPSNRPTLSLSFTQHQRYRPSSHGNSWLNTTSPRPPVSVGTGRQTQNLFTLRSRSSNAILSSPCDVSPVIS
jgi:hypothetical protein